MKTFSGLSLFTLVCLGLAMLLIGNTAQAAPYSFTYSGTTGQAFPVGEKVNVTFRLIDLASGNGVNAQINLVASGGIAITSPASAVATGSANTVNGILTVQVEITSLSQGTLAATPNPLSLYSVSSTAFFNARDIPEPPAILVVRPPVLKTSDKPDTVTPDPQGAIPQQPSAIQDLKVGDIFVSHIEIENVVDLSSWQMDIAFNPAILEVVRKDNGNFDITEGNLLEGGNINAFFPTPTVDNATGKITGMSQTRIGREPGAPVGTYIPFPSGVGSKSSPASGRLVSICFRVKEFAEESLGLHNVQLSNSNGQRISYGTVINPVVVTLQYPPEDVNRDGSIDIGDLSIIAALLGQANPINPRADINEDDIVNVLDIILVASKLGNPVTVTDIRNPNRFIVPPVAAPSANTGLSANLDRTTIQGWIDFAQVEDDGSAIFDLGIANLEALLASRIPSETRLLLNYPNPFNPETWIPYQLSETTDVTVTIHSMNGSLIRTLALGHQAAGIYQSKSQAAYWDGRNEFGEQVASGLYFYTLTAGNFSATGKMLVRK